MVLLASIALAAAGALSTPSAVLAGLRRASGGNAWMTVRALRIDGRKTSFGLAGSAYEVYDLRAGYFKRVARYQLFANAEGLNAEGRWRQDSSGSVHPLDSREAVVVARTEAYLARRGYLQADASVQTRMVDAGGELGAREYRVDVTPRGGRTATLWVRKGKFLLDRISVQLSERVEEWRFADYRRVHGLMLPFQIAHDHGDELDTGTLAVAGYRFPARLPTAALSRPEPPKDVTFRGGTVETTVPAPLDPHTGFRIVEATINGHGPFPFILDTGGHDILTPRAAAHLGLSLAGAGKSFGAGSGSTATRFTKVARVGIGDARITAQPFSVLSIDLGTFHLANGRIAAVAGIIGLEIFERFRVAIDFDTNRLTLARAGSAARAGARIPIVFTSDMPLTDATLDGARGVFGIDTGNNLGLIVHAQWLRPHGLMVRMHLGKTMASGTVGGTTSLQPARVDMFALGPGAFRDIPAQVSDMTAGSLSARSEAGSFGDAVLGRFKRVTFDYRTGSLYAKVRR